MINDIRQSIKKAYGKETDSHVKKRMEILFLKGKEFLNEKG